MATLNMVDALNQALMEEMERDERVVVMGEDVGKNGGVFRVTVGLLERFGSDRVIDTPLAEAGIVGTAIGMAVYGLRPVAEIQFMGFIYYTLNQIITHAARLRNRTRGRFTVPMVVRTPYGTGIKALEHHSESTEALFTQIPGIKVVVPSTPKDAKGLLVSAIRDPDPVIFLEPTRIYRAIKEDVPKGLYTVPLGKARIVKEGDDVTVICWGAMVREVERAVEIAEREGIDMEIIDLRALSPLDIETIITSVTKTGRGVIIHEAPKTCGLGAEISALIQEKALLHLQAPVLRVTGFDITVPYPRAEDYYIPNPQRIMRGIREVMSF
ncbi:MAG: alpha-ketoacid dehydrogenase subunit beta [Deltaproteobacteria bacterium]|nr:alpha-ketoacid dehydrogenase subunit beta [Deltaproteobacteria bacterium]